MRVRLATGQLLGALAGKRGAGVFRAARSRVLTSILEHYVSHASLPPLPACAAGVAAVLLPAGTLC